MILIKERKGMNKFVAVLTLILLSPSVSLAQEERIVAVLPFTSTASGQTLDLSQIGQEMAVAVEREINLLPGWRAAVSSRSAQDIGAELGCGTGYDGFRGDSPCAARVALRLNSDYVILGRMQSTSAREGDTDPQLIVDIDLFEATSQELYATAVEHSPPLSMLRHQDDLNAFVHALVRELMENVAQNDVRHGRVAQSGSSNQSEVQPSRDERLPPSGPSYHPSLLGYLGWGATGLTVVSAVFMIGSMVYVNSLGDDAVYNAYRASVPSAMDDNQLNVCQEARAGNAWGASDADLARVRSICDQGETWETIQFVAIGGTVIFGLASVVLHIMELTGQERSSREQARVTLVPSLGPDHGYVSLAGTF